MNVATSRTIEMIMSVKGTPNGILTNITIGEVNGIIENQYARLPFGLLLADSNTKIARSSGTVIGSINCFSYETWLNYAKRFEESGCDALELNMAILPYETSLSANDIERTYTQIINALRKSVSIPISVKVGSYFTDMAKSLQQISWMGTDGVTLFNKSVQVDIDIESETLKNASYLSVHEDMYNTLRWVALMSKKMRCDLSASTGVYTADDVVKMLLAGASSVQVVSCLYKNGIDTLKELNDGLQAWMQKKGYENIAAFRGKLAVQPADKASIAMRTQFMKYFAEIS